MNCWPDSNAPEPDLSPCVPCEDEKGCFEGQVFGYNGVDYVVDPCPCGCHKTEVLNPSEWYTLEYALLWGEVKEGEEVDPEDPRWGAWEKIDDLSDFISYKSDSIKFKVVRGEGE